MGFDQFAFPIPKPPAALPMPPSTLKGVIFRGPWPVPPPVTVTPVSPVSGPAGSFGPVVPSAPVKPASKAGGSPFLKSLLAQGLPKPPGVLPIPESTPTQSAVGTAHSVGPARIIFLNEYAADPVAAAKTLSEVAAKAGGTARFLGEETPDGKSQPKGVLFAIPTPALEDFLHRAVEAGELRDRTAWSGTVDARRAKLAEDANALVASLKRLREALLVTYLPDAAPVKDTDADIARAEAAATQLQLPEATDNLTIVRINFVAG